MIIDSDLLQSLLQSAIALQGIGLLQFAARPFIGRCKCKIVPAGNRMQKDLITKHILKTDFGVTGELEFNEENGNFNRTWNGTKNK